MLDRLLENYAHCPECGGECCRSFPTVSLTWIEYQRLKTFGANRLYYSLTGRHKLIIENGCEFLANGKCSIYADRPDICRRFICLPD